MKFYFGVVISSILIIIISSIIPEILTIPWININLRIHSIFDNLSASLILILFLGLIYKIFGEEETISILRRIIRNQQISEEIQALGIKEVKKCRGDFETKLMEKNIDGSNNIQIMSMNFEAIKYDRLRNYLINNLNNNENSSIEILIHENSTAKDKVLNFKDSLVVDHKKRVQVRTSKKITCGMYAGDKDIYATLYLLHLSGDESPAIHIVKEEFNENCLFSIYKKEFSELWKNGTHF